MMKSVLLDGSSSDDGFARELGDEIVRWLAERGYTTRSYILREHRLQFCMGEFDCWVTTPGVCRFPDAGQEIAEAVVRSDFAVFLTPVTFGSYSAELKKALDRMICLLSPSFMTIDGETHHKPRYGRYPGLLGVGLLDEPDAESALLFETLVRRNARNLHVPWHSAVTLSRRGSPSEHRERFERCLQGTRA